MAEDKETETGEQGQEEYQYAGEEFAEEFGAGEDYQTPGSDIASLPGVLGKKFIVPAIILIVAAGVYMFMNYTTTPPEEGESVAAGPTSIEEKLAPAKPEPPVEQVVIEPPVVPTPTIAAEPPPVVPQEDSFEAEQRALAAIREKSSHDQAVINDLQSTINELQATVGDLGKAIITISEKMGKLESVARKPAMKQRKARATRKAKRVSRPKVPPMVYEVKSVVPGRAWIQSSTGEFLSIAVGERLPGYGKVERINPATGVVTLSSGAVIKYGYYDR